MVHVKHQFFKNSEKGVKTGNLYRYNDQSGIPFRVFYENAWPNTTPSEAYLIGFFNTQQNHYFFNNFCAFQQHALLSVVSFHIRTSGGRNKLPGIPKKLENRLHF